MLTADHKDHTVTLQFNMYQSQLLLTPQYVSPHVDLNQKSAKGQVLTKVSYEAKRDSPDGLFKIAKKVTSTKYFSQDGRLCSADITTGNNIRKNGLEIVLEYPATVKGLELLEADLVRKGWKRLLVDARDEPFLYTHHIQPGRMGILIRTAASAAAVI